MNAELEEPVKPGNTNADPPKAGCPKALRRQGYRAGIAAYVHGKETGTAIIVPSAETHSNAYLKGWTLGLRTGHRMDSWAPHDVSNRAYNELQQAAEKHPPMRSAHEGLAVLEEELHELRMEVYKREADTKKLTMEALQVAAMAMRFVLDVCMAEEV